MKILVINNNTYYKNRLADLLKRHELTIINYDQLDGYDATRAIRAAEQGSDRHVIIVALTANAMAEDREHCLA